MQTSYLTPLRKLAAWLVHLFTASAGIVGLFTLQAIYQHHFITAFWLMWTAIFIDAVDGSFARAVHVKKVIPKIDGALLDNIMDYFNYVITPAAFLLVSNLIDPSFKAIVAGLIILASAYQFTQSDAKTPDNFFKGFPSYWNIVIFYLYLAGFSPTINLICLIVLIILVFVPIKYAYPSRLDNLFASTKLIILCHGLSAVYGLATVGILYTYPQVNSTFIIYSMSYVAAYLAVSAYRNVVPLRNLT